MPYGTEISLLNRKPKKPMCMTKNIYKDIHSSTIDYQKFRINSNVNEEIVVHHQIEYCVAVKMKV